MNTKQKVLLVGAIISYVLFLIFFVRVDLPLMLIFFVLQSVLLILFAYTCWRASADPEEALSVLRAEMDQIQAHQEETGEVIAQLQNEKKELKKTYMDQITTLNTEKEELERQVSSLMDELTSTRAAATEIEEKAEAETDSISFLPQVNKKVTSTVNIIEIANNAATELHAASEKVGLTIRISATQDSYMVKANPEMLRIMFRNIMDNSIKYMNRRGVLIVTISNIDDDLFIVLKDNGEGLPENETRHIFELNYQGSNRISGNGLGLTQAKAIIEYYGGTVYAKSNSGKGMGIYIQLPTNQV